LSVPTGGALINVRNEAPPTTTLTLLALTGSEDFFARYEPGVTTAVGRALGVQAGLPFSHIQKAGARITYIALAFIIATISGRIARHKSRTQIPFVNRDRGRVVGVATAVTTNVLLTGERGAGLYGARRNRAAAKVVVDRGPDALPAIGTNV